ncbi:hypothetical protein HK098_006966 [Nowakowskiella sp. JEL0407]|nr:hypothetical protein HK098_006966 [Nowakowskiella sp. JEL0407]
MGLSEKTPLLSTSSTRNDSSLPLTKSHIQPDKHRTQRWKLLTAISITLLTVSACFLIPTALKKLVDTSHSITEVLFGKGELDSCIEHGVKIDHGRKCVCDIGYTGPRCSKKVSEEIPQKQTILFVLESIGELNPNHDLVAESYAELTTTLAANQFLVDVLYIGNISDNFNDISSDFLSKGVNFLRLPDSEISFGNNQLEKRSFEVSQYLNTNNKYSTIYFTAQSGSGYFYLLQNHQGRSCSKSKLVVGLDGFWESRLEQLTLGINEYYPTKLDTLKLDHVQRKSIEFADQLVVSSQFLLENVRSAGWELPNQENLFTIHGLPVSIEKFKANTQIPEELVFVGSFEMISGMKMFCDLIDEILPTLITKEIAVSFVGFNGRGLDESGTKYIKSRASSWDEIRWKVMEVKSRKEILKFMKSGHRLAVLPTIADANGLTAIDLLSSGIPFVTTKKNAVNELVENGDHSIIVHSTLSSLVGAVENAITTGVHKAESSKDLIKSWLDFFKNQSAGPESSCLDTYSTLTQKLSVTVILTHRNRMSLLKQTLKGLEAQTFKDFELILIDNGTTNPKDIAYLKDLSRKWNSRRWKVIFESKTNIGALRNIGVGYASSKYILFMDDDDIPKSTWIEKLVKVAVNTNAEVVAAGSDTFTGVYSPSGKSENRYLPIGSATFAGVIENVFGDSHFLTHRAFFEKLGGFDEDNVGFEHYAFFAKVVSEGYKLESIPEALTWSRIHSRSLTWKIDLKMGQSKVVNKFKESFAGAPENRKKQFEKVRRDAYEDIMNYEMKDYGDSWDVMPSYSINFDFVTEEYSLPMIPIYETVVYTPELTFSYSDEWTYIETGEPTEIYSPESTISYEWSEYISYSTSLSVETSFSESISTSYEPIYETETEKETETETVTETSTISISSLSPTASESYGTLDLPIDFPEESFTEETYSTYDFPISFPSEVEVSTSETETQSAQTSSYTDLTLPVDFPTEVYPSPSEFTEITFPISYPATETTEVEPSPAICQAPLVSICGGCYTVDPRDCRFKCPWQNGFGNSCVKITSLQPSVIPNINKPINITILGRELYYNMSSPATAQRSIRITVNGQDVSKVYPTGNSSYIIFQISGPIDMSSSATTEVEVKVWMRGENLNYGVGEPLALSRRTDAIGLAYAKYKLLVYQSSSVISVSPTVVKSYSSVPIRITVQNLVINSNPICIFNQTIGVGERDYKNKILVTTGKVNGTTAVDCLTPPNLIGYGETIVYLRYDNPISNAGFEWDVTGYAKYLIPELIVPVQGGGVNNGLKLIVPDAAPVVTLAQFTNNGTMIAVTFNRPVKVLDENGAVINLAPSATGIPCEKAFITKAQGLRSLVGTSPLNCKLVRFNLSPNKLWLQFNTMWSISANDAIKPLYPIRFKDNAVYAEDTILSQPAAGDTIVSNADSPPPVSVSLSAPNLIPGCGTVPMNLEGSSGETYRKWDVVKISYVNNDMTPENRAILDAALPSIESQIAGFQYRVTIPSDAVAPGVYFFTVTLTNFLGAKSSASFKLTKFKEIDVPVLVFTPKSGDTLKVNTNNILSAQVLPACAPELQSVPVKFQWSLSQSSPNAIDNFPSVTDKSILALSAFSMKPSKSYTFNLVAKYDQDKWNSYSFDLGISTSIDTLTTSAGASRLVGIDAKIIMNAIIGSDGYLQSEINARRSDPQYFSCTWRCRKVELGGDRSDCLDNDGNALSLPSKCAGLSLTGTIPPGKYEWQVQTVNLDTNSKASSGTSFLTIIDGKVPSAEIFPSDDNPSSWDPKFVIDSDVDPDTILSSIDDLKYTWSFPDTCDDEPYTEIILDDSDTGNMLTDMDNPSLKLVSGTLVPDEYHCIKLQVEDPLMSFKGEATYVIKVRDRPHDGECNAVMDPQYLDDDGNVVDIDSFSDIVQVKCTNWVTDPLSYPLYYIWEIRDLGRNTDWSILSAKSVKSTYRNYQASGRKEIRVTVIDAAGSPNEEPTIIKVTVGAVANAENSALQNGVQLVKRQTAEAALADDIIKATAALTTLNSDFKITGDGEDAQGKLTVITSALPQDMTTNEEKSLQSFISNFTSTLINSGNVFVDTDSIAPWFSSLFVQMAGKNYTIQLTTLQGIFKTMYKVLQMASASGKSLGACFNSAAGTNFISAFDVILGSLNQQQLESPEVSQLIDPILQTLETCMVRTKACGESPFSSKTPNIARSIGIANAAKATKFCNTFTSSGLSLVVGSSCVSYACGSKNGQSLYKSYGVAPNNFTSVDYSKVTDLVFRSVTNEADIPVNFTSANQAGYFNITLDVGTSLSSQYDIFNYAIGQQFATANSTFAPQCVFLQADDTPSSNGCTLVALDTVKKTVTCQCTHLTDFAVAVLPLKIKQIGSTTTTTQSGSPTNSPTIAIPTTTIVIPTITATPTPPPVTSDNTGIIAGASAAAAAVLIIAAGAVFFMRKKRAKQQAEANKGMPPPEKPEPTKEPQVEIQMDGEIQLTPPPPEVPSQMVTAELVPMGDVGGPSRRRDPALLPMYQSPPTYEEHMRKKELSEAGVAIQQENSAEDAQRNSQLGRVSDAQRISQIGIVSNVENTQRMSNVQETVEGRASNAMQDMQRTSLGQQDPRISGVRQSTGENNYISPPQPPVSSPTDENLIQMINNDGIDQQQYEITQIEQALDQPVAEATELAMEEGAEISYLGSDDPNNDNQFNNDAQSRSPRESSTQ